MPITSSAKKALRAGKRKKVFNDRRKNTMRDAVKEAKKATPSGDSKVLLATAYKAIDKAAKRGVISAAAASRKKSQVSAALKKVK